MSADLKILQAFDAALSAIVVNPAIVAWQGVPFEPKVNVAHYEVHLLPAATENPTVGDGFYRRPGIYQVTVCAPGGVGSANALTLAGNIVAAFSRGRVLAHVAGVRVIVDETPSIGPAIPSAAWLRVPVSISYVADVNPAL